MSEYWKESHRRVCNNADCACRSPSTDDLRKTAATLRASLTTALSLLREATQDVEDAAVILGRLNYPSSKKMAQEKAAKYRAFLAAQEKP